MTARFCQKCGNALVKGSQFCAACGVPVNIGPRSSYATSQQPYTGGQSTSLNGQTVHPIRQQGNSSGLKIAALVLGILGAVAGFIGGALVLAVGGLAVAFGAGGEVAGLALGAIAMSIAGLIGALLAIAKPRLAAVLMAVSAIGGLIFVFVFYILAMVLLLIAALLAFLGRKN